MWATEVLSKPNAIAAMMDGMSFWVARFRDKPEICEWETDWALLDKRGMTELRLVCPNRRILVLHGSGPYFQLKIAAIGIGGSGQLLSHLIGEVIYPGHCLIHAWEPDWEEKVVERYQEPANDGSGGIVWKEAINVVKHPGKTVEQIHCKIEPHGPGTVKIVGYYDYALTGMKLAI